MKWFTIEELFEDDDGIGGHSEEWVIFMRVEGYLDLISGDDRPGVHNAFIEDSTHILILPKFTAKIEHGMRVSDKKGRIYHITYADNPVNMDHHNELYLKYGGAKHEFRDE